MYVFVTSGERIVVLQLLRTCSSSDVTCTELLTLYELDRLVCCFIRTGSWVAER